jgi:hypothetical protein
MFLATRELGWIDSDNKFYRRLFPAVIGVDEKTNIQWAPESFARCGGGCGISLTVDRAH